jgi:hypothetical protein
MAAPHLGQRAVPGDTSIKQREQAGKSATVLPGVTDASAQAIGPTGPHLTQWSVVRPVSPTGRGDQLP